MIVYVAVLSTTELPIDGTYSIRTVSDADREEVLHYFVGVPHFVSHPDTKAIVEAMGAVQSPTRLFEGLKVRETCVCVSIKQGSTAQATENLTAHRAISKHGTLDIRVITRVA